MASIGSIVALLIFALITEEIYYVVGSMSQMTTSTSSTTTTVSKTSQTSIIVYPDNGTPPFFTPNGYPNLSVCYPFYIGYNYRIKSKLLRNSIVNERLAYLSYFYGIRINDMYQMYELIETIMPTMSTDYDLRTLEALCKAIQRERCDWLNDKIPFVRSPISYDQVLEFLPKSLPNYYLSMLSYVNYRVPGLSDVGRLAIYNAIKDNIPRKLNNRLNYLDLVMRTFTRYMLFAEMKWIPTPTTIC